MHKLPIPKPSEVIKALQRMDFIVVTKGSHLQLKRGNLLVTIPMHNKDLKTETLKSILRQAKISVNELKKNL